MCTSELNNTQCRDTIQMEDQEELRSFLNKAGVSHVIDNMLGESLCIINYAAGSTHCWVGIGLLFYTSI